MRLLARPILLILGFLMPIFVVAGARTFGAMQRMVQYPVTAPPALAMPEARAPTGLPVAVLLASNRGTEVTDLLYPYAVLSASLAFDVVVVAPERRLSPVTGGIDLLPDHSFASFAEAYPAGADLIVVPFFLDATASVLVDWLALNAGEGTPLLAVCEGVRTAAAAGLLVDRRATTHFWSVSNLAKHHPDTRWLFGARFVEDEEVITSAGVTASLDGAFAAVRRLAGDEAEARAKEALGIGLLPVEWATPEISYGEIGVLLLNGGFLTAPVPIGVAVAEGVDELHLAALLDTFPRSLVFDLTTLSAQRTFLRSRFGMTLLARATELPPVLDRLFVPAGATQSPLQAAAVSAGIPVASLAGFGSGQALEWSLARLAEMEDQATATLVGDTIEAPQIPIVPGARAWPWPRFLVLLGIGGAGVLVVAWLTRAR
ncbi:MAG: DJ-1/PfpI family protein [Deltaproteobacteria bacterium]